MIVSGILFLLLISTTTIFFMPSIIGFNVVGLLSFGFIIALFFLGVIFFGLGFPLSLFGSFFGLELSWADFFKGLVEFARGVTAL